MSDRREIGFSAAWINSDYYAEVLTPTPTHDNPYHDSKSKVFVSNNDDDSLEYFVKNEIGQLEPQILKLRRHKDSAYWYRVSDIEKIKATEVSWSEVSRSITFPNKSLLTDNNVPRWVVV